MLHLYVLYACLHVIAGKHAPQPGKTQCVESRVFFQAGQCKGRLPKGGGVIQKSKYARRWLECQESRADSWIPADPNDGVTRLYEAQASITDESALAALLAPLAPRARAALGSGGFNRAFQRAFQGPGRLSFFVVGTGSSVIVFALSNLDDFQFADVAADVSSSTVPTSTEDDFDFQTIAEDAGVQLSYHTEISQRAMPPPGGMEPAP